MSKDTQQYKLRIFMMEIMDKTNNQTRLFSETVHMFDNRQGSLTDTTLEIGLKDLAVTLIHHKKNHSFLKVLKEKEWCIDACLAETKVFPSEQAMDGYIQKKN